ncbi:MAG: biotin/lipoyl-binding carrier protein [Acidimicrobiia bacterium]
MTDVRAEITANVWQVSASVGDVVAEGDEIAILESMKMEIPVVVEVAGTITQLTIEPGGTVREGDLMAVIEPAP